MAKPKIKIKNGRTALFSEIETGDTFFVFVVEDRIRHLCMRCGTIYNNDGETVAWNAVNLATGDTMHFKDDDVVTPVQIEIEVTY